LSCSGDKTAIIWKKTNVKTNYEIEYILNGHNSLIDIGCSIVLKDGNILTITSSNDLSFNIWKNDQLVSSTQNKNFMFDIKLISSDHNLFKDKIVVLIASSDTLVHLFKFDLEQFNLIRITKLIGHHEWVRSVDFVFQDEGSFYFEKRFFHNYDREKDYVSNLFISFIISHKDTLMIASGAQDNFIRVWKIQKKSDDKNLNTDLFFQLDNENYSICLDTVITGHEDKVCIDNFHSFC
jgi:WD40 repeat protein